MLSTSWGTYMIVVQGRLINSHIQQHLTVPVSKREGTTVPTDWMVAMGTTWPAPSPTTQSNAASLLCHQPWVGPPGEVALQRLTRHLSLMFLKISVHNHNKHHYTWHFSLTVPFSCNSVPLQTPGRPVACGKMSLTSWDPQGRYNSAQASAARGTMDSLCWGREKAGPSSKTADWGGWDSGALEYS